jgi:predicted RNA-binding Zn ribbon-like protein
VDFVNTLRERWRRRVECLTRPSDLAAWLVQAGLLERPVPVSADVLVQARSLREAIDAAIVATVAKQRPPAEAIQEIDAWLPRAVSAPRLRLGPAEARLRQEREPDPILRALGELALDATRMLGTAERDRLRICAGDCSARLYDRSPAGRRSWCSMRTCGNVAKARRHRNRARRAGPDAQSSPSKCGPGTDQAPTVSGMAGPSQPPPTGARR